MCDCGEGGEGAPCDRFRTGGGVAAEGEGDLPSSGLLVGVFRAISSLSACGYATTRREIYIAAPCDGKYNAYEHSFIFPELCVPRCVHELTFLVRCSTVGAHHLELGSCYEKMAEGGPPRAATGTGGGGGEGGGGGLGEKETWELFSNWVCCVCVVTFDLELGQALEVLGS